MKKVFTNVVSMFTKCELTGHMVPNVRPKPMWILLDENGHGMGLTHTLNEAIQEMSMNDDICGYEEM